MDYVQVKIGSKQCLPTLKLAVETIEAKDREIASLKTDIEHIRTACLRATK